MPFDLARILTEVEAAGAPPSYPAALAAAVISDCIRRAGRVPPPAQDWHAWSRKPGPHWEEQLAAIAHLLNTTSLRDATVEALSTRKKAPLLPPFFEAVAPISAEMVRTNPFRREEFLRRWIEWAGGRVLGETPAASAKRLEQLDYRKTLSEYAKADRARKAEAERRARLLAEAAAKEAEAKGWRE
jgi:hypothetical protein